MARIHLVVGPVGSGKSTLARRLCREHRGVRLTLDEWMTTLFSPDRPDAGVIEWYVERAARCVDQIWTLSQSVLEAGSDVVLEIGLIRRHERDRLYRRVDAGGHDLIVYVVDADRALRRERVAARNETRGETFSMVVPTDFFEMASDMWEPPDDTECEGREFRFISTDP